AQGLRFDLATPEVLESLELEKTMDSARGAGADSAAAEGSAGDGTAPDPEAATPPAPKEPR
ncbi:MogA/MoaB family molybdenum cofactor biosynthesis protein, partial [bacterium]|nr:MogA/MoaB family molybdenum cofactor biosynthesis protein [bacterium]